jgi:hypothetical protein
VATSTALSRSFDELDEIIEELKRTEKVDERKKRQ